MLVGDKIFLCTPGDEQDGPQYEGYVHEVRRQLVLQHQHKKQRDDKFGLWMVVALQVLSEDVLLKFHESFHSTYSGEDYNVRFSFNR